MDHATPGVAIIVAVPVGVHGQRLGVAVALRLFVSVAVPDHAPATVKDKGICFTDTFGAGVGVGLGLGDTFGFGVGVGLGVGVGRLRTTMV